MSHQIVFTVCVDCGKPLPKESANGRCEKCSAVMESRIANEAAGYAKIHVKQRKMFKLTIAEGGEDE